MQNRLELSVIVYKEYDQSSLDAEYNNQAKVSNFMSYVKEWNALCDTTLHEYQDHVTYCYDEGSGQKLDLIYPSDRPNNPCPVQIFFHGGYWKALSKDNFTFVARAFAEHGIATAIVDYGLIPMVTMQELVTQCRRSVAFLYAHSEALGLDADQIHVSGHSAGGHLAAMCLATDWTDLDASLPAQIIKSAVGVSGLYNLLPIKLCFLQADLKLDMETVAQMSPVNRNEPKSGLMHLVVGSKEGDEYLAQSNAMHDAWPEKSTMPQILSPYNHFSIMSSLADPSSELARLIRHSMNLD